MRGGAEEAGKLIDPSCKAFPLARATWERSFVEDHDGGSYLDGGEGVELCEEL